MNQLKTYNNDIELLDLSPHISRLRMIKEPEELAALQSAIDITNKAIKSAMSPAKLNKYRMNMNLKQN